MRTSNLINNPTAAPRSSQEHLTDEGAQWLTEEAWASEYGRAEMAQLEFERDYRDLVAQDRGETPANGAKVL